MTYRAVYLDAASAEPLHPAARDVLLAAVERGYADPRRLHGPGRDARLLLDNAREVVAASLEVRRDEVSFTSSGTAAIHLGLAGLVHARGGGRVVYTPVEHAAVSATAAWAGEPVELAGVMADGRVRYGDLVEESLVPGTAVVALQTANHEVGTVQPVGEFELAHGVPLFTDAAASMGRLPLPDGWAVAAGSAHKWGGPPGVGVLVIRKGTRWVSPFPLDDRVDERVPGFENVPAALAAAAALQAVVAEREEICSRQRELIDLVRARVSAIPDVDLVGDPVDRLPHLVTFSCLYVDGEALVTELDRRGFGITSGSACASSLGEPSRVLAAMGALTHGNVRLSLTRDTTRADVERFLDVLPDVVSDLRSVTGL